MQHNCTVVQVFDVLIRIVMHKCNVHTLFLCDVCRLLTMIEITRSWR